MKSLKTVLIIDDDPILQSVARGYFESRGAEQILQAMNGFEARSIVQEYGNAIDFIQCDINMPELDGVELLSSIKDQDFSGPIVIVSSTHEAVINMARDLGTSNKLNIIGTLAKPFDPGIMDELIACLEQQ